MATPLPQYWTDEIARLQGRRTAQLAEVAAQRSTLTAGKVVLQTASDAVRTQAAAVDEARKDLAGIPTPADGSPLLAAMEAALVGLAEAQATLAANALAVQVATTDLARKEAQLAQFEADLAEAQRMQAGETGAAAARQKLTDALLTGNLATLSADAGAALTAWETNARARVEGEFPSNSTAARSFLDRVRDRRAMVRDSLRMAGEVETAAFNADTDALAQAQRRFQRAALALRSTADAQARVSADTATLRRFAELPAATSTTFPILTRWQHDRLHDSTRETEREDALAKLTAIDQAVAAVRPAQEAYDTALHAAMKADPDKTQAQLDAGAVAAERGALDTELAAVTTARGNMNDTELDTVKTWFAAVPDVLWDALEKLDTARARLGALGGAESPANVLAELASAETALATALAANRLAARQQASADLAESRASTLLDAERETVGSRAAAYAHSAALF